MNKGIIFIGSGLELLAMVLSGLYLGEKLDAYYKTNGKLLAACFLIFFGLWLFHFIYLLKKYMESEDNEEKSSKNDDRH